MIICENKKWVFIKNPKTASRSVSDFLLNNFNCFELGTNHSISVPNEYYDFDIYLVIRNPFARAVSAWKHVIEDSKKGLNNCGSLTFLNYLKNKKFYTEDGFNLFLQSSIIESEEKYRLKIINYENLEEQIKKIFGKSNLKKIGKSFGRHWSGCYNNRETISVAIESLEIDLEKFNYDKNIKYKIY